MKKVQVEASEVCKGEMSLLRAFVRASNEQGFKIDYVERVLFQALENNCENFRAILLEYVEIITTQAPSAGDSANHSGPMN